MSVVDKVQQALQVANTLINGETPPAPESPTGEAATTDSGAGEAAAETTPYRRAAEPTEPITDDEHKEAEQRADIEERRAKAEEDGNAWVEGRVEETPPVDKVAARKEQAEKYRVEQAKRYAEQARRNNEEAGRKLAAADASIAEARNIKQRFEQFEADFKRDPFGAAMRHFGVKPEALTASAADHQSLPASYRAELDELRQQIQQRDEQDRQFRRQQLSQQQEQMLRQKVEGDVQKLAAAEAAEWPEFAQMSDGWRTRSARRELMRTIARARRGEIRFETSAEINLAMYDILETLNDEAKEELQYQEKKRSRTSAPSESVEGTPRDQGTRSKEKAPGRVGTQGPTAPANGKGTTRNTRRENALRVAQQGLSGAKH